MSSFKRASPQAACMAVVMAMTAIAAVAAPSLAAAQTTAAAGDSTTPVSIAWTLQVLEDGSVTDTFHGVTRVGQAVTQTHSRNVRHDVGCREQPAAVIELKRTIGLTPLAVMPDGAVDFDLDAQETLEDTAPQHTADGCLLPPQPRVVHAHHPGLAVPQSDGAADAHWTTWSIVPKNPSLEYRLRAARAGSDAHAD
ncbi:MAG: hypothetical protein ACRYG5_15845 [Janthinobacterium lividum]